MLTNHNLPRGQGKGIPRDFNALAGGTRFATVAIKTEIEIPHCFPLNNENYMIENEGKLHDRKRGRDISFTVQAAFREKTRKETI